MTLPGGRRPALVRVAHPRVLGEFCEIIAADSVPAGFPANASDTLGICFKLGRGHGVWCEGRNLHYPDDAVCIRAPGCYWSCEPCADGFISIDIPVALLPPDLRADRMHFLPASCAGALRPATLHRLADPGTDALETEELLAALLLGIGPGGRLQSAELQEETHYRRVVRLARDFLLHNLAETVSLPRLARAAGTTRWGLIRAFTRELDTTPHAFLVQLRLGRARQLLRRGHRPAEVAALAGFADQAHLTRLLRRFTGEPPRAYMARHWRIGFDGPVPASGQFVTFVQAPPASSLIKYRASAAGSR